MSSSVRVEVVEEKHLGDVIRIRRDFLNSKHCCCVFPLGDGSEHEVRATYRKHPELMKVAAVASTPEAGAVGFVQLVFHGMHSDIHTAKEDEAYIDMIAVVPEGRGMGVGTALMNWAEDLAKQRGCTFMALEVLHGNPAIGLYERKGYVVKPRSILYHLSKLPFICFIMSPCVCPSGSRSYCSYGRLHYMEKQLE